MASIKLKITPSFWLFLAGAIFLKKGYFALLYMVAVTLHEVAHYVVAKRLFYNCNQIKIGIFGAVLYGEFDSVTPTDRIKIALAGPICNLVLCLTCLALWWILPDAYPFTDTFFQANLSMAVVNLMPFYPLDGGRVTTGILQNKVGDKALSWVKKATVVFSLLLFLLFLISLFTKHNLFSLGMFSIFLFSGVMTKSGGEIYVKSAFIFNKKHFKSCGMEKKTLVFDQNNTLRDVAKRMQGNYLYALEVVNQDMQVVAYYSVAQLEKLVVTCPQDTLLKGLKKYL